MRTLLTTVGASLLTNAARTLRKEPNQLTDQELANYLRTTPAAHASAETNSLSRLLKRGDQIIFLHSDTPEGERCARLLANYYHKEGYQAKVERIPDLQYQESRFKMRGLRALVALLCRLIQDERARGVDVIINATGGFKAEIAYATLVGLLFRVPVHYIHELFREIVEMPPVPVSWDYALMADHEDFFEWLEADLRSPEEVARQLKALRDDVRRDIQMLLVEEDGFIVLSPAGKAFYEAFRERMREVKPTIVWLSSQAYERYARLTTKERCEVDEYLRRLRLPEWRIKNAHHPKGTDCVVVPRGRVNWRLLYYEDGGKIYVVELAKHDEYERLLAEGVWREKYRKFCPWKVA